MHRALLALGAAHPMDGWLAAAAGAVPVPGLDATLPVSPTALEMLLGCPHRFLLERVIGFQEPSAPPALREIGQPAYGRLFHLVAEQVYRRYGEAFYRGEGTLAEWQASLDPIVNRAFETFVQQYPLVGETVREHERLRQVPASYSNRIGERAGRGASSTSSASSVGRRRWRSRSRAARSTCAGASTGSTS